MCQDVVDLTANRRARGQQWVMVDSVEKHLADVPPEDLREAMARSPCIGSTYEAIGSQPSSSKPSHPTRCGFARLRYHDEAGARALS